MATFIETLQSAVGLGGGIYARRPRLFSNFITTGVFGVWAGSTYMRLSAAVPPTRAGQAELSRYDVDLTGLDTFGPVDFMSPMDFPPDEPNDGQTFLVDGAMNQDGVICVVMGQQDEETGAAAGYDVGVVPYDPATGLWGNAVVLGYLGSFDRSGTAATETNFRETEHGGLKIVTLRSGKFLIVAATNSGIIQWLGDKSGRNWSGAQLIKAGVANQFKGTKIDAHVDTGNRLVIMYDEHETLVLADRAIRRITMLSGGRPRIEEEETVILSDGSYYPRWPSFVVNPFNTESMDLVYAWKDGTEDYARVQQRRNATWGTPIDLFTPGVGRHTPRTDPVILLDDRRTRHIAYCRRTGLGVQNLFYKSMTEDGLLGSETIVAQTTYNGSAEFGADPTRHPAVEFPSIAYLPKYDKIVVAWDAQVGGGGNPNHVVRFAYSNDAVSGVRLEEPEFTADCFSVHCPGNHGHTQQLDVQETGVTEGLGLRSETWWEN